MEFDLQAILGVYYGLDWVASILGLYATHLITKQKPMGYLFGLCSALASITVAVMAHQNGTIFYNVVFIWLMLVALRPKLSVWLSELLAVQPQLRSDP